MLSITGILLTILFIFKENVAFAHLNISFRYPTELFDILPSSEEYVNMEHDITKSYDRCINNVFNSVDSDTVWNLLYEMKNYKMIEFEHKADNVLFGNITFFVTNCKLPLVEWDFCKKNLQLSFEKLFFNVKGDLHMTKDEVYAIHVKLELLNVTMDMLASPEGRNEVQLTMVYDSYAMSRGLIRKQMWTAFDSDNKTIPENKKHALYMVILEALPSMLVEYLNRYQIFDSIYNLYNETEYQITSTYPDVIDSQRKFYYFIPRIPFYCYHLKNIIIKGLMNFQLIHVYTGRQAFTHTLLIKNVEGRLLLDYGRPDETPMKLNFRIDYLTISVNKDSKSVNVNARYYYVNRTGGLLTYRQAPVMMSRIETAIASSIMPSMNVERTCDVRMLQFQVEEIADWHTMKQAYKEWIPFNNGDS